MDSCAVVAKLFKQCHGILSSLPFVRAILRGLDILLFISEVLLYYSFSEVMVSETMSILPIFFFAA